MTRKAFYETPLDLEEAIEKHRQECIKEKEPVTLTGMLLALGFKSKRSFYYQADREDPVSDDGPTWKEVVEYGMLLFEHEHEKGLHKGGNSGGHIFGLKNAGRKAVLLDGWRDKVSHEVSGPDDGPIRYHNMSDDELEAEIKRLAEETGIDFAAEGEEETET